MKHTTIIVAVGLALAAALPAAPASALNARSFVSGHGNDANTCLFAAPCRTFVAAYAKTNAGGEISVLDPAGYGPLTITTALSIVNDGVGESSIVLIAAGNAITISAGAGDAVSLRGLTLDGSGTASTKGIVFNSGASLTIANCVVRHFGGDGIAFQPNATSNLAVSNSLVADNGAQGIAVNPTGVGTRNVVFNRVETNNNTFHGILVQGVNSTGTINATVAESVAANNGFIGLHAFSGAGQSATTLTVFHSVSVNNNDAGIASSGTGATLRLAQSEVTGNAIGWNVGTGGVLASYGDNYIDGNGANTGSLTLISKQ